jgi:hypothetical protein
MNKISIICLIAGCLSLVMGVALYAANPGMPMLGLSTAAAIGIGLMLAGMLSLVSGIVVGLFAWKARGESKLGALLNISVAVFLLLLCIAGVIVQWSAERKSAEWLKDYRAGQETEQYQDARSAHEQYHKNLWDRKVIFLESKKLSKNMGALTVCEFTVIAIPSFDSGSTDGRAVMLGGNEPFLLKLLKVILTTGSKDDLAHLQAFGTLVQASCLLHIGPKFINIFTDTSDLFDKNADIIEAIDKELHLYPSP